MQELHTSVRNLVEFILRGGDIDNRSGRMITDAMMEGSKIHRKIQRSMGEDYQAEVPLALTIEAEEYMLVIEGRADGIAYGEFPNQNSEKEAYTQDTFLDRTGKSEEMVYIDEIKGVYRNVATMEAPVYVHKAQAMCYAYIYALQNHLDQIGVQMTYCNLDTEDVKLFQEVFAWDALADWFGNLIAEYRKWADWQIMWRRKRQESIQNLEFPYPYREGQRKLVGDVYRTIRRGKNLFLQAPTGVGKTISTIFPAVKAVGEELANRIFYLTAKTITATVAKETFGLLREQGYQAKIIQLTAKEKLCLCGNTAIEQEAADQDNPYPDFPQIKLECNPQNCPYAKGHFDRVNDAVFELLQASDLFTREEILAQARKHRVCPFELSLDVATWCDNILCDYNYVFDPNVYLKRFFQDSSKEKYLFLVDEAHNLVDRSREMYSATLYKEDILAVKKIMKPHNQAIARTLDKCNKAMLDFKRECENYSVCESVGVLTFYLMRLVSQMEEFFEKPREFPDKKTVLDFYFELRNFVNIYDLVDENYVIYDEMQEDGRFMIKLFCVDPSKNLQKCIDKSVSTIFFSATLLPINYYKRLLSTKEDNYAIYAQSTFDETQRLLAFGRDVSTKYTRRGPAEYEKIARYIRAAIRSKKGNYMVFFPSYKMMQDVYDVFVRVERESDTRNGVAVSDEQNIAEESLEESLTIIMQHSNMNEAEREEFLQAFEQEDGGTLVAFCVMGGIFGEGIDLKNDRLIGAVIVGTGLPQISNEREILKQYYDKQGLSGFDYAFRYPGINKVLQAAGRVIRTQEDRGIIVLLDERFLQSDYNALYPREWKNRIVGNVETVDAEICKFWENTKDVLEIKKNPSG
ncbi:MAG: ATP-dependent DNA helicase [Lachnobacterium sp.]|nr:ATP-dependent DNA helicase [Lachnobacterium sp.]MDY5461947.1 ATP-dependent DNA helicase [Agathobacter sp.]